VVGCVLGAARTLGRTRAVLLAVAVAILFGVVAVLTKASVLRLAHGGLPHLLSVPTPYVLAVVALPRPCCSSRPSTPAPCRLQCPP